jgi:hypothetical protein
VSDNIAGQPEVTSTIQEPIVKSGGESFTSFDDLENVTNFKQRENDLKGEGIKNGKEKSSNEKSSNEKSSNEESKISLQDPEKKAQSKLEKSDIKKEEIPKQTEPNNDVLPQIKTLRLKNGDQEINLRHDTMVPVKIDGRIEEIPMEELVRNFSGSKAVDERFKQYSQDRYKFDNDKKEVDSFITDVFSAFKEDPVQGLLLAAERSGYDPVQLKMNLLEAVAEQAGQWNQMSEQDKQLYRYQQENAQLKGQHEKFQTKQMQEKQTKELDLKVNEIQTKLGVSREDFAKSYFELEKLSQSGKLQHEVTPELVADYISDQKKVASATEILSGINKDLGSNKEALESILEVMYDYPKLGIEDIRNIAKEYYGKVKPSQKITEKLSKGKPDLVEPKRSINAGQSLTSFDELDLLFR